MYNKNKGIIQTINEYELNCLKLVEMNLYSQSMSTQQQLKERTRGWFDTTVSAASYNKFNTKVSNQQDGAAFIARAQLAYRCTRVYDPLGRWIVVTIIGRGGMNLRIVSAYQPQPNKSPYSVYQQQLQYYTQIKCDIDPLTQFDNDLIELITCWSDNSDQLILMIDANENLATTKSESFRKNRRCRTKRIDTVKTTTVKNLHRLGLLVQTQQMVYLVLRHWM